MRVRWWSAAGAAVLVAVLAACTPSPRETLYVQEPEYCPYDDKMVQFNGDSIGFGYAARVQLPEGYSKFVAAQGASTWTIDIQVPLISTRVKQFIEQCGAPGAVVIEGGVIDLTRGVPADELALAVGELSDWLEARDIPTLWLALTPIPIEGGYAVVDPVRREYNDWLTTDGNVWGSTVDCTAALEDPQRPGWLAPRYWKIVDLFGTPDGVHPNEAGYDALARCVEPALADVLAAG